LIYRTSGVRTNTILGVDARAELARAGCRIVFINRSDLDSALPVKRAFRNGKNLFRRLKSILYELKRFTEFDTLSLSMSVFCYLDMQCRRMCKLENMLFG